MRSSVGRLLLDYICKLRVGATMSADPRKSKVETAQGILMEGVQKALTTLCQSSPATRSGVKYGLRGSRSGMSYCVL